MHTTNSSTIQTGAKNFVDTMAQRGINFLGNPDLSAAQKTAEFEKLLSDSFAMKTIARFALGRYWRTASKQEQSEYLKLFEDMVLRVYAGRFTDYQGQSFEVAQTRAQGSRDTIVTTFIIPDNGNKIQIDWRVRYKNSKYKIVDVMVEGVSMALTQRSDFASVIQRGGGKVSVLLDHLRK